MFSTTEIDFLAAELKRFTEKGRERIESDSISDTQRKRLEARLVTVNSIRRKLQNEKNLREQDCTQTPTVLLIDDMDSVLQLHRQYLRKMGFHKVDTASDGKEALKRLKEAAAIEEPYGLIICDWEMPKLSGLDVLKQVRLDAELWATPFYLLTSRDSKLDIFNAISLGATGYIVKPVSPASLEENLKDYIVG